MRFLWVEDFNEDSGDKITLKNNWIKYFDLKDDKLIDHETLKSVLEYLDNEENLYEFDYILIDIRFPLGSSDLYEKYFKEIITEEVFYKYADKESGTGILLYLALTLKYNFNKNRIVFISANVNSDSEPRCLKEMYHILYKCLYMKKTISENNILTPEERERYFKSDISLYKLLHNYKSDEEIKEMLPEFIDNDGKIIIEDYNYMLNHLEEIDKILKDSKSSESNNELKYNSVKKKFSNLGLKISQAYEKPTDLQILNGDKSWEFLIWKGNINKEDYYRLRSCVVEMCTCITKLGQKENLNVHKFNSVLKDGKRINDINEIISYLKTYIASALPNLNYYNSNQVNSIYNKFIKELSYLWEGTYGLNKNNYFSYHAVMKTLRNWNQHKKLNKFSTKDVAFIFIICMRGFFEINAADDVYKEYEKYENELLDLISSGKKHELKWGCEEEIAVKIGQSYGELYSESKKVNEDQHKDTIHAYNHISNIGSEKSDLTELSMQYIYKLFWHCTFPFDSIELICSDLEFKDNNLKATYSYNIKQDKYTPKDEITNKILESIYEITWESK
ncbi:hypothetical protein GKZ28_25170 [Clostridium chromiireducens]|uniref:Uncharacterized protein n=1 Tax=Clostridium chromiireducens TaxID=225345 RepID=A0A964W540_9CLOT|nr:hypothetical protein [Clostridium chromiireducens]MVX66952.1 hypothetical protein [Clostridium chromiireducens]